MSQSLHVKPARPGLRILMPDHAYAPMPDEGAVVLWDAYYVQMIKHGDIVEIKEDVVKVAPEKPSTPKPTERSSVNVVTAPSPVETEK